MFKKILIFISIFFTLSAYGQSDVEFVDSDTEKMDKLDINPNQDIANEKEYYKKLDRQNRFKKVKDLQAKAAESKPTSVHSAAEKKNLEALLDQVRKENSTVLKAFGDKESQKKLKAAINSGNTAELLKQLSSGDQNVAMTQFLKKGEAKKTMEVLLSPYRKMGYRQVHAFLQKRFEGTKLGELAKEHTFIFDILAKLLVDRSALPQAVSIIEKRAQLALVVGINIALFILGFVLARFKKKFSFFSIKRAFYFIFRVLLINGMRIGVIIYFFGEELDPLFQVISSSL